MVHSFDTSISPSGGGSTSGGGSNALIWVLGIGLVAFLGYTYIVKPQLEKEKQRG